MRDLLHYHKTPGVKLKCKLRQRKQRLCERFMATFVLGAVICLQILYDIVLHARYLYPSSFLSKVFFIKFDSSYRKK